jgi:hypothetical protein
MSYYDMPSKKVNTAQTIRTELPVHALGMPELTEMEDILENAPESNEGEGVAVQDTVGQTIERSEIRYELPAPPEEVIVDMTPVGIPSAASRVIVLPDPKHIISLASSGLLVSVETHVYTGVTQNKEASAKVTADNKASRDAAKVVQNLFSHCPEHKAIIDYRTRIYNWSQSIGYDWAGKLRYIPQLLRQQFQDEYAVHKAEFDRLSDEFVSVYETSITAAAMSQGALFNKGAYPSKAGLRQRFSCEMFPMTIPVGDFREDLFQESAEELKRHYEKQAARIVEDMMGEASTRLQTLMSQISNACTDRSTMTDANGKKARSAKVYETTVDKAKAIGAVVRSINITNDPDLEEAARRFEEVMGKVSFNDLRESALIRHETKEEVDKLLPLLSKFAPLEGGY